jgi:hypothetical protein
MKRLFVWTLVLSFVALCTSSAALAGDDGASANIPKLLRITKYEMKPGHSMEYASLVRQVREKIGDADYHWIAASPMTGPGDRMNLIGFYDSYAQIEQTMAVAMKAMSPMMQSVDFQRGVAESVMGTNAMIARYREDLSYHPEKFDVANATCWDITMFKLKPGAGMEFNEFQRESIELHKRANVDEYWAAYEVDYGVSNPTIIYVTPMKSLAELDKDASAAHKQAFNESVRRRFAQAAQNDIVSVENTVLMVRPELSKPSQTIMAANPTFWTVKDEPTAVATKKKMKSTMQPVSKKEGGN